MNTSLFHSNIKILFVSYQKQYSEMCKFANGISVCNIMATYNSGTLPNVDFVVKNLVA